MAKWAEITQFNNSGGGAGSPNVDRENGIIHNVVMCQVGEAKGHGVQLDKEFISNVVKFANEAGEMGIKARFNHPSMSAGSLGDGLGRFKSVRLSEDGTQAIGDLHLAEYASKSPEGDLRGYVLSRAEEDGDSFGSSIVFTSGKRYKRNKKGEKVYGTIDIDGNLIFPKEVDDNTLPYQEIKSLHECDLVDSPAATNGMFSEKYGVSSTRIATLAHKFLNDNPQAFEILDKMKEPEKAIMGFLNKYKQYKHKQSEKMGIFNNDLKEQLEALKVKVDEIEAKEADNPGTEAPDLTDQFNELSTKLDQFMTEVGEALSALASGVTFNRDALSKLKAITGKEFEPQPGNLPENGKFEFGADVPKGIKEYWEKENNK